MSPLMTEDLLSRIKEALERATPSNQWGAKGWQADHCEDGPGAIPKWCVHANGVGSYPIGWIYEERDAAYIALLSPENVRALIGEVERLTAENAWLSEANIFLQEQQKADFDRAEKAEAERDAAYADLETLREWTLTHGATHASNILLKGRLLDAEREVERLREELTEAREIARRVPGLEFDLKAKTAECEIADGEIERLREAEAAWTWFASRPALSLERFAEPEEDTEWRVWRERGSVNDREWDLIGSGATPYEAVIAARQSLQGTGE